jgi:hypothetical protein
MSRRRVALFATLLAAAALIAVGGTSAFAASKKTLVATMTAAKERRAGPGPASGHGTFTGKVNKARTKICYSLTARGIGAPILAHIHVGGPTVAGPVVIPLKTPKATGVTKGCAKAPKKLLKKIVAHPRRYYVNVHTNAFKAGAIRGQLKLKR